MEFAPDILVHSYKKFASVLLEIEKLNCDTNLEDRPRILIPSCQKLLCSLKKFMRDLQKNVIKSMIATLVVAFFNLDARSKKSTAS